jgi:hypothetical protein
MSAPAAPPLDGVLVVALEQAVLAEIGGQGGPPQTSGSTAPQESGPTAG